MKVLIFGSEGFMGRHFLRIYPDAETPQADIANPASVAETLDALKPDVVINCAGKTGRPNVDWCEENKRETVRSNVTGPLVLLEECSKRGIHWVHLSTGCIYDSYSETPHAGCRGAPPGRPVDLPPEDQSGSKGGTREFTEDDPPNFFGSFYSRTKGAIDQILKEFPGVLQLRLRMPFDGSDHPRNLIMKLRGHPRVLDVKNSLTFIPDFLTAARTLIARRATGTYHVVNPGAISPYRIMEFYREIVDPSHRFERLALKDLPREVRAGRSNCILATQKLEREGIRLRTVEEAVREALKTYREATMAASV